jgi:hypothetical protein
MILSVRRRLVVFGRRVAAHGAFGRIGSAGLHHFAAAFRAAHHGVVVAMGGAARTKNEAGADENEMDQFHKAMIGGANFICQSSLAKGATWIAFVREGLIVFSGPGTSV